MRRFLALALVLVLVPSVCFGAKDEALLGILSKLGITEKELNTDLAESSELKIFSAFKFFDTLNSMLAAFRSGRIAAFFVDSYTASYLLSRTDQYALFRPSGVPVYNLNFSMLLREEDSELCGRISEAIKDMKADGTLETLKRKYIDECITGTDPEAVKPEHFDGAETLRVALTGDLPPMDYISAAGQPIGFNTALVSEIARRLKMNAEFLSVDSGARAAALSSKMCDVVFWSATGDFNNREGYDKEDIPEHTIITESYLGGECVYVTLSDSPLVQK